MSLQCTRKVSQAPARYHVFYMCIDVRCPISPLAWTFSHWQR